MNYRIQDLMKLVIPGMYVEAMIFGYFVLVQDNSVNWDRIKEFNGIILFLIPFVGYVLGYLLECLMSLVEHLFYTVGRRPSKTILKGCNIYALEARGKILEHHRVQQNALTNNKANEILQSAKQLIDREKVEHFRNNSMSARNLFGGQLILSIIEMFVFDTFCSNTIICFSWLVSLLFFVYWVHHTHNYVKYVLAEYGKII